MARNKRKAPHNKNRKIMSIFGFVVIALLVILIIMFPKSPKLPSPSLKDLGARHGIDIGIHALEHRLNERVYSNIVTTQFNQLTIDREAHWDTIRPSPETYDFRETDAIVSFAEKHGMKIQLHHLLWGERSWLPGWLKEGNYSSQQLRAYQKDYIQKVVSRYKGRVNEWSVSNEAFTRKARQYNLRDWWADNTSDDFTNLDNLFIWAKQADPNAILLLNDFHNEEENDIANDMYDYIKEAKKRGVPIDGIGMQLHVNAAKPPSRLGVIKNMQRFGALGVPSYVTEFDVNVNSLEGNKAYKRKVEATVTYEMVRACIESKSCNSFSVFGVSDKNDYLKTLLNTDSHSFLFDSRFRPKPSFFSFREALVNQ